MSIRDCINRAVAGGEMDKAKAERILREYDGVFAGMADNMGHTAAQAEAARVVVEQAKRDAFNRRRTAQLQAEVTQRQTQRMMGYTTPSGKHNAGDFLIDLIDTKHGAKGETLYGRYDTIRKRARGDLTQVIAPMKRNLLTKRKNVELVHNIERELFEGGSGDKLAAKLSKTWLKVAEDLRLRFNAAGGKIEKLDGWGLPQSHDMRKVARAGFDTWRNFIVDRLDLGKMGGLRKGVPFTPQTIELLLKDAYDAISTDGLARLTDTGSASQGKAMHNRKTDHRFFIFKDAQNWREYNMKFGDGLDAIDIMLEHVDVMSRDTALMEVLGPNDKAGFRYLAEGAQKLDVARNGPKGLDHARKRMLEAENLLAMYKGEMNVPGSRRLAVVMSGTRQWLSSAMLGSAMLSSLSDFNSARVSAGLVGMGQTAPIRAMSRVMFNPGLKAELSEAGMIFENAVDLAHAAARQTMEDFTIRPAARLTDFTIRSTGLGAFTELGRASYYLGFLRHAVELQGTTFSNLDPKFQRALEARGISKAGWELIRQAKPHTTAQGLKILRYQEIEAVAGRQLADQWLELTTDLLEFAVPSGSPRGKAMFSARKGTVIGEAAASFMQFKAFSVALMFTHVAQIVREARAGRPVNALTYMASFIIGNTLLGGIALQLKSLKDGKDPRDMTTAKFWGAAFMQGGGLGIMGDLLFSDQTRYGGGFGQTAIGPVGGLASDTVGFAQRVVKGDNVGGAAVDMMRRYTPGGKNWQYKLILEREIWDQLQSVIDPKASRGFRRRMKNTAKYDTNYFWKPGQSVLGGDRVRAPNFGNAIGK